MQIDKYIFAVLEICAGGNSVHIYIHIYIHTKRH